MKVHPILLCGRATIHRTESAQPCTIAHTDTSRIFARGLKTNIAVSVIAIGCVAARLGYGKNVGNVSINSVFGIRR